MRNLTLGLAARAAILVAALAVPGADAAHAGEMIDATDPAGVLSIVRNFGDAALTKDGMGDPLIEGRIDGKEFVLYFYECEENRDCKSLMFFATWEAEDLTDEMMAEWNREKRFGKAYIDEDDRAAVEMNVNLHGGVTRDNLNDTLDWWRLVLVEFSDYQGI
jgi:hypothetical protein